MAGARVADVVPSNQASLEHWNGPANVRWVTEQQRMDRVFDQLDDVALVHAAVQPGERVVDIGCGCGASALRLAQLVGPRGSVLGLDFSRIMLERARERAQALPQLAFCEADAAAYPFSGDAALLYSRLGVMFFGDPAATFAHLRRALRPGGRLCMVAWRSPEQNAWYTVPLQAASAHVALPARPPPESPGPFSLASAERFTGILRGAGFADVALHAHDVELQLSSESLDDAVHFALQAGPLARILIDSGLDPTRAASGGIAPALGDGAVSTVRAAVRAALARHESGGTVALGAAFWVATAVA